VAVGGEQASPHFGVLGRRCLPPPCSLRSPIGDALPA